VTPASRKPSGETSFHVLSFEGPDAYCRAGGIATRVCGLAEGLAGSGFRTHLWFVGDPQLSGHEVRGSLELHRWCQWISRYHPGGVYDAEEAKRRDYVSSLPPYLLDQVLRPALEAGQRAAIFAEEWHTVDAVLHLDWLLRKAGMRQRVSIFWNANNTFGFHTIDWERLARAATLTTVSRYMKHLMWRLGVDPLVLPNGIDADALRCPGSRQVSAMCDAARGRTLLAKVARWDPDKRWLLAVDIVAALKKSGARPLLFARGGVEAHGAEVLGHAERSGLRVTTADLCTGTAGLVETVARSSGADVVLIQAHLGTDARKLLFRSADAVLANSGHEPFGLVGLEAMAAGGVACTGCSGEDYAIAGENALVLESNDPHEFLELFGTLRARPGRERALRRAGRTTARRYTWPRVIDRVLLPRVHAIVN
jgi:glycosyltransferase involved in cell wall biosynthesis